VQDGCDGKDGTQLWRVTAKGTGVVLMSSDGERALAPAGQDGGRATLGLVAAASGTVWTPVPG
jgi:hypothetical protein